MAVHVHKVLQEIKVRSKPKHLVPLDSFTCKFLLQNDITDTQVVSFGHEILQGVFVLNISDNKILKPSTICTWGWGGFAVLVCQDLGLKGR